MAFHTLKMLARITAQTIWPCTDRSGTRCSNLKEPWLRTGIRFPGEGQANKLDSGTTSAKVHICYCGFLHNVLNPESVLAQLSEASSRQLP